VKTRSDDEGGEETNPRGKGKESLRPKKLLFIGGRRECRENSHTHQKKKPLSWGKRKGTTEETMVHVGPDGSQRTERTSVRERRLAYPQLSRRRVQLLAEQKEGKQTSFGVEEPGSISCDGIYSHGMIKRVKLKTCPISRHLFTRGGGGGRGRTTAQGEARIFLIDWGRIDLFMYDWGTLGPLAWTRV